MKTYYCVTSAYYDSGRVVAGITDSAEADAKPDSRCTEARDRDIWSDWFETIEEAKQYVKETKGA